ncbi:Plasmodium variant antigen protein Cir/Yir/Bir, putative [Plasmodium chabaudi adami]|uniref:Plasmodium variant antigen protein Cir/Yir/Bir, putative n=1 Tax=Plasmodium chabaudi adami TaxID=5826 RepID=A0A1D3LB63_PLACE|nr:Plasmodium variant antigen protein Cir/Yir/Bir, putative [Plasmodium chabaudi adami]
MDKNVCNLFIKVDNLFNNGNVKENAFNIPYTNFCPKGGCNTNYDRIGALCDYLLTELPKLSNKPKGGNDNGNQNYELVFMWLADKFLKITHDISFSLNDYYEDFLVNHKDKFNYWDKLDNIKYLKDSNLSIMSAFYYLFKNICNALVENDISKFDLKKFKKFDYEHYRKYNLINSQAYDCYAYIKLLADLKKKYDEYRNLAIKQIPKDQRDSVNFLTCPEINNKDNQAELKFQSNGCKQLHLFFGQPRKKPIPKTPPSYPKSPSNDLQNQKGEANKPTNNTEKDKEPPKDPNNSTKKESQPSIIGEELNIEKIRDYSVKIFKTYSPLFNNTVTRIENYMHDMVISNFNDMVGKTAKYLKVIQAVKIPQKQNKVVNHQQKESEKSKKEKVEPSTSSQTTEKATVSSDGISSKVVDNLGNNVMRLSGNIEKLLSFKFEGYKGATMAFIAVSIPIVLAIMYKYLYYGCGKTSKKKKIVKKIINSHNEKRKIKKIINPIDGKRTLKTVINPVAVKNTTNTITSPNYEEKNVKTIINSDYGEKRTIVIINSYDEKNIMIQNIKSHSPKITLLNTYKHIYVNPAPFINLFFLLIFFVYKRKYDSLK